MTTNRRGPYPVDISSFQSPFDRQARLLHDLTPQQSVISLVLGEPQHPPPLIVSEALQSHDEGFSRYPPIRGTEHFGQAIRSWLRHRYRLSEAGAEALGILPLSGSREGLALAARAARDYLKIADIPGNKGKEEHKDKILLPDPFYQAYAAAGHLAGAQAFCLPCDAENNFLPDFDRLSEELLNSCLAVYIASPANPQGSVISRDGWQKLINLARHHRFMIFADECYSEIYRKAPPCGILEAAHHLGEGFAQIVSFNSLSKRSNLPGIRCGFAAGDMAFINSFARLRAMCAPQVPTPIQYLATKLYCDEGHVVANRALYNRKFAMAVELLQANWDLIVPRGGFFLWANVAGRGGGENFARALFADTGVAVLPGNFLSAGNSTQNDAADYIRLALVPDIELTRTALTRINTHLQAGS